MAFLRMVEVFPPLFRTNPKGTRFEVQEKLEEFVKGVESIKHLSDIVLVASVKDPGLLRFSSLEAAILLHERIGIDACPVLVVRDANRLQFLSNVLTGVSLGLKSMMIAWGDRYPKSVGSSNVRDFEGLGESIARAKEVVDRSGSDTMLLSTVDVERLSTKEGVRLADEKSNNGAGFLLAQPPTTDPDGTFERHSELVGRAGLKHKVLLNVFPFKDKKDVERSEANFGWKLPPSVHKLGGIGSPASDKMYMRIIERLREERFPGVYVSTRGNFEVARRLLS